MAISDSRGGGIFVRFREHGHDRYLIMVISVSLTICIYSKLCSAVFVMSLSVLEVANNALVYSETIRLPWDQLLLLFQKDLQVFSHKS